MASPSSEPRAGGALIALGALLGAGIGMAVGESSAGLLIGLGVTSAVSIGLWLRDRAQGRG